tara:strand:- start:544 stop:1134 length:591 start_codon:yes stop_codon:yes gene_type:complete
MARPAKRDAVLATAKRLFYRDGIRATGIDRILDEAGVARMTLYNHFAGKDELIAAALQERSGEFRAWLQAEVEQRATDPRERLLAVFDVVGDWIRGERAGQGFAGCAFIKAAAEYGDSDDPVHRLAAGHKAALRSDLAALARAAGAAQPEDLAARLLMLVDGAIVTAQVSGDAAAALWARELAGLLLASELPPAAP